MVLDRFLRARRRMLDAHGKTAARAGDARRVQPLRDTLAVQRGGHHDQPQVRSQGGLHVERQRRAEIAGEMALVKFVEHHRTDAAKLRIGLDQSRENAFGDHLDSRRRAHHRLEAYPVTDGLSDRFAELPCHELRGGARGDATRLQQHDFLARQPVRIQ